MMQFLIMLPFFGISQDISKLTSLHDDVAETSGLIFFDDRLITHNDSGGMNALYEINSVNGAISRTVNIQNASNIDWEDISQDDDYIYIGDFGNNNGNRKNLRIYKILKTDYLNSQIVSAEFIEFAYQDQNDFTSSPNQTNLDAEALISFGPDIYIFTKNWVDQRTNIYKVPKVPGTYTIEKIPNNTAADALCARWVRAGSGRPQGRIHENISAWDGWGTRLTRPCPGGFNVCQFYRNQPLRYPLPLQVPCPSIPVAA